MLIKRESSSGAVLVTAFFTALVACAVFFFSTTGSLGVTGTFVLLTFILLAYLAVEVRRARRLHPTRWMINPAVLCSVATFGLSFGVTNIIYFLPGDSLPLIGAPQVVTASMNKLMFLVVVGALAMWLGYWSPIASKLTVKGILVRFRSRYFTSQIQLLPWALPGLLIVSLVSRLIQVWLGAFGYSSTYDRLIELAPYTQYFSMGASLGKLALIIAAFQYYDTFRRGRRARGWLIGLLIYEVVFGFLTGFKSLVIMPLIIVALCEYLRTGKLSRMWSVSTPLALIVAYMVIEPFRVARNTDAGFDGRSVTSIAATMTASANSYFAEEDAVKRAPFLLFFGSRLNYVYVGSLGIAFADENEILPEGSPEFLNDLYLSPLHAWIPRIFWEEKSLGNLGLWYTQVVMGLGHMSATGMTPFTYLYFAGGIVAVFVGFFLVGIIQRVLFFITQPSISVAGGIVFLNMLSTVVLVDSAFNGTFIALFRELPIILIVQSLLYKRLPQGCANEDPAQRSQLAI